MSNAVDPPKPGNADNVTAPDPDVPEKFAGKSVAEVAQSYVELESKLGQQSSELSKLRQMLNESTQAAAPPAEEVDFYSDPQAAVAQTVQPLAQAIAELRVENMKAKLASAHPNYEATIQDVKFQEWVADSRVRIGLWNDANVGDFHSARELFSTWETVNQSNAQAQTGKKEAVKRDRKLRAATTEKGSVGLAPGKTFNNQDLIELKRRNPEKYRSMSADIVKAYAEGRVTRS